LVYATLGDSITPYPLPTALSSYIVALTGMAHSLYRAVFIEGGLQYPKKGQIIGCRGNHTK